MKRLFLALCMILLMVSFASAGERQATFQWKQDVMVDGDYWEVYKSEVSGGPYTLLYSIPYVTSQTIYENTETIIIDKKTFFVFLKVNGADGERSKNSNEVFLNPPVNAPSELTVVISSP